MYFADGVELKKFYNYYTSVTDVFGKKNNDVLPLNERYTSFYFVIANGREVKPTVITSSDSAVN